MPEAEKKEDNISKEPMVDLDTSGPGANVELPEKENEETKTYEKEEKKNEANDKLSSTTNIGQTKISKSQGYL